MKIFNKKFFCYKSALNNGKFRKAGKNYKAIINSEINQSY